MGELAQPYLLRPYPRPTGEAQSRLEQYLTSRPPLDDNYRPRPTEPHVLELIEKLKRTPANIVAQQDLQAAAQHSPRHTPDRPARVTLGSLSRSRDDVAGAETLQGTGQALAVAEPPPVIPPLPPTADEEFVDADYPDGDDETNGTNGKHILLPGDDDYIIDDRGVRRFAYQSPEGAGFIAVNDAGLPLTDATGDYIFVDRSGADLADKTPRRKRAWRFLSRGGEDLDGPETTPPVLYDENGAPVADFTVPKAGGGLVVTERVRGMRMLTVLAAAAVLALVFGGIFGILVGRSAVPAEGAISAQDAEQYRLSTFPMSAAAAFGEQYLHTCFTHGDATQVDARKKFLDSMSTAGADPGCGWTAGGAVQEPELIAFTGRAKTATGFSTGQAAYLYYNVSMEAGQFMTISVPVWVQSQNESNDMKVVGNIGITAPMRAADPENYEPSQRSDMTLVADLKESLIEPYLRAWSASNNRQIGLTVTSDAFPDARTGLNGDLENPELGTMSAYTNKRSQNGEKVLYNDGDTAEVVVQVTWDVPNTQSTQTTGYRIGVRNVAGKWLVTDIGGGAISDRAADPNTGSDSGIGGTRSSSSSSSDTDETSDAEPTSSEGTGSTPSSSEGRPN